MIYLHYESEIQPPQGFLSAKTPLLSQAEGRGKGFAPPCDYGAGNDRKCGKNNREMRETFKTIEVLHWYQKYRRGSISYEEKLSANELRGKFTESEWKFLAASLNGSINEEAFRYTADLLCFHNEDSERYDGTATQFGVNLEELNGKIRTLSASQLDALYSRVEEFWDNCEKIDLDAWARF